VAPPAQAVWFRRDFKFPKMCRRTAAVSLGELKRLKDFRMQNDTSLPNGSDDAATVLTSEAP